MVFTRPTRRQVTPLRYRSNLAGLCLITLSSCGSPRLKPTEGFIPVRGGNIWYQVVGTGTGTPLLLIHGGPGGMSCWHAALKALGDDRPIVFYDQLGAGRSDRPRDTTLWTLPRFVDEVDAIRDALHLRQLIILGHSWGGAVATEYMIARKPTGVRALVLAAALVSTPRWILDANYLRSQLSPAVQTALARHEADGSLQSPEYLAATDSFYARYLYHRNWPPVNPPECDGLKFNEQVYRQMWGPTEFKATGSLLAFDDTPHLGDIRVPVLLIGGEFDEARPETMRDFQRLIPDARVETIGNAGHMAMIDQPQEYVRVLRAFLRSVDRHQ